MRTVNLTSLNILQLDITLFVNAFSRYISNENITFHTLWHAAAGLWQTWQIDLAIWHRDIQFERTVVTIIQNPYILQ